MKPLSAFAAMPASATALIDLRQRELAAAGRDIISFCVGEPDFAAPDGAPRAGIDAVRAGDTRYTPVSGTPQLKKAVCTALERDCSLVYAPEQIAVTTGGKFAVHAVARVLAGPGDEVILPAPCWTSYAPLLRLGGIEPVIVKCQSENGWRLTPRQLESAIGKKTKALILNNPGNPTGAVYPPEALFALADICRAADIWVVADEIYSALVYAPARFLAAAAVGEDMFSRTVTVGGVSKRYAMTGWRIGFAAGPEEIIRGVAAICSHTTGCPAAPSQAAAAAALTGPQESVEIMRAAFCRRRDRLMPALLAIEGLRCVKPDGAFYALVDISAFLSDSLSDDRAFALALLEQSGVATVPGSDFEAPGTLRLSFTLDEERMLEGVARIRRFIATYGRDLCPTF